MMPPARLLSIQIGTVTQYNALPAGGEQAADPHDRPWITAFFKTPIAGPVQVGCWGIEGDAQADRENHGGVDKAVLFYAANHYPRWQAELGFTDMPYGGFGENFTVTELDESSVCIGDTWQLGNELLLQISQPRQPCWKLARRWRIKELPARVIENHRSGWYGRVLQAGKITPGDPLVLQERPHMAWSVARASDVMYHHKQDRELSHALASLPELSASWREELQNRG